MRAQMDIASAPAGTPRARTAPARRARPRRGPDWFELAILAAFALASMWLVGLDLHEASAPGLVWTGTDGFFIVDQMQYLAWIQGAAHHLLASNLFVLRHTPADYFQPAVVISAALTALGVPAWIALLVWKPVAVVALFYGVRAYAHRSLAGAWPRRIALAFGLFFGSVTIIYGTPSVLGDLFPLFLSWGYTFGLLAIALLLLALVAYQRALEGEPTPGRQTAGRQTPGRQTLGPLTLGRLRLWVPGLLGALASLLHPWQGEMLIVIVIGTELVLWRLERGVGERLRLAVVTVVLTGVPLLYYEILGRTDLSWKLARDASKHSFSLGTIVLAIAPLLVPALLAYRDRPRSFLAAATRVWPVAAFVIYFISASSVSATPLHSFEGITVPLSVLAIEGLRRSGWRRLPGRRLLAGVAVAAATIPATLYMLNQAKAVAKPVPGNANFITPSEQRALRYLARDRRPGGVLTGFYLGEAIPAETGRRTYVGDCLWSEPDCPARAQIVQMLFNGTLPVDTSRWLVQAIGARFVLAACDAHADMDEVLAPLAESVHHFGCAAVYTLRDAGSARVGGKTVPHAGSG
jgi:hypothetical protein